MAVFPRLAPLPYPVSDLLERLRKTKWFFHAGGRDGTGLGAAGPAHRDPTWRHLRTGLSPAPPSDQAISCFAQTPILVKFKLLDLDSKNSGLVQGEGRLTPYPQDPWGTLGLRAMQAWQMLPILQMAAGTQSGVSLAETEHTEYPTKICGISPAYPGDAQKRGPAPGKSLCSLQAGTPLRGPSSVTSQLQGLSTNFSLA